MDIAYSMDTMDDYGLSMAGVNRHASPSSSSLVRTGSSFLATVGSSEPKLLEPFGRRLTRLSVWRYWAQNPLLNVETSSNYMCIYIYSNMLYFLVPTIPTIDICIYI